MSGPPPCTTIGLSPTYFSSTTSRAKSSRSAGSVMAAPPYLMTTVLPWNSRMYGSASSSVPMSRISEWPLGRVVRVDGHVVVREVGEEDLGLGALAGEAHGVLDLGAAHRLRERGGVVGDRLAARADLDVLDEDVQREGRGVVGRRADRLGDPAPVRVAAVQRGLDQRRVRHRPRRGDDQGLG